VPQPWRNGAGTTQEVLRSPATGPQWHWRVSIATIEADGAFSDFSGYDRVLTPVDGPVDLDVDGTATRVGPGESIAFRGEAAVVATLVSGPTRDVNAMVQREWGTMRQSLLTDRGPRPVTAGPGEDVVVVCLGAAVATDAGPLSLLDAVHLPPGGSVRLGAGDPVLVIGFQRR
jgi:environmental stress-induced protein Ves